MPVLDRPAGAIRYDVTGSGPPLLLSHGFGATSAMFDANLEALDDGNQVITWDLRGHGGSESPADPAAYRAEAALADMAALLDEGGHQQAILGGHSLGGYLSLSFAIRHPDRVTGLLLIGTGPGFRNDEARDGWNQRAEATAGKLAADGVAALGPGSELHGGGHRDSGGLVLAARGTLTQHNADVINGLPRLDVPVLIVVGANDKHFLGAADYMEAKLPRARKVVISDAGHAPNVDKPELFDLEARDFLDELAGG